MLNDLGAIQANMKSLLAKSTKSSNNSTFVQNKNAVFDLMYQKYYHYTDIPNLGGTRVGNTLNQAMKIRADVLQEELAQLKNKSPQNSNISQFKEHNYSSNISQPRERNRYLHTRPHTAINRGRFITTAYAAYQAPRISTIKSRVDCHRVSKNNHRQMIRPLTAKLYSNTTSSNSYQPPRISTIKSRVDCHRVSKNNHRQMIRPLTAKLYSNTTSSNSYQPPKFSQVKSKVVCYR